MEGQRSPPTMAKSFFPLIYKKGFEGLLFFNEHRTLNNEPILCFLQPHFFDQRNNQSVRFLPNPFLGYQVRDFIQ